MTSVATANLPIPPQGGPAVGLVRGVVRRVRASASSRVVVLLYHRIGSNADDPHRLAVTPERFDEQLQAARAFGPVLSLSQLAHALESRRLPRRATVITFDDGYADNLYRAKPMLERHDVPATVFMTTGPIGRQREFWWDQLAQILLSNSPLPRSITLELAGARHEWHLVDDDARHRVHDQIHRLLWDLPASLQQSALDELARQCGVVPTVRAERRALNDDEILALDESGLIEIGAHTHNHPNLAAQPVEAQAREIRTSKLRLEALLCRRIESFAYPFGMHTSDTVQAVREAGFARACACLGHAVRNASELHRITRAELGDLDGDQFARALRKAVSW